MFKISKCTLLTIFLFFSTVNLFSSNSLKLDIEKNINALNSRINNKSGVLGLKLEPNDNKNFFLLELETAFKAYRGFLLVGENQVFNRYDLEEKIENNLFNEIEKSSYEDLSKKLGSLLLDAKFVKTKNLVVGDRLQTFNIGFFTVKNIFNVKPSKSNSFNKIFKENNYSFFCMNTVKNFYIKKVFSIDHVKFLLIGGFYGPFWTCLLSSSFLNRDSFFDDLIKIAVAGEIGGITLAEIIFWLLLRSEKNSLNYNNYKDLILLQNKRIMDFFKINYLSQKIEKLNDHNINLIKIDFIDEDKFTQNNSINHSIHKELLFDENGDLIKNAKGKIACLLIQNIDDYLVLN